MFLSLFMQFSIIAARYGTPMPGGDIACAPEPGMAGLAGDAPRGNRQGEPCNIRAMQNTNVLAGLVRAWARVLALCLICCGVAPALAQSVTRATGQQLYLPVYSHILHGEVDKAGKPARMLVSVLVSVRNTDPTHAIRLTSAQYYDTDGKRIKEYVTAPRSIAPMGTFELYVPTSDDSGGSGANFLIAWKADAGVNAPVVEALHVNLPVGRSIVFITTARVIQAD